MKTWQDVMSDEDWNDYHKALKEGRELDARRIAEAAEMEAREVRRQEGDEE